MRWLEPTLCTHLITTCTSVLWAIACLSVTVLWPGEVQDQLFHEGQDQLSPAPGIFAARNRASSPAHSDVNMASSSSPDHGWASVGFGGNILVIDINMAFGCIRSTDHSRPSVASWDTSLDMVTRITQGSMVPEAAKPRDITKASDSGTDCIHPHGSLVSLLPGASAWTKVTYMASSGSSRRSSPESEPFLISGLCCCPEPGESNSQGTGSVAESLHKLQAYAPSCQPYRAMTASRPVARHHRHHVSGSICLHSAFTLLFFYSPPLHYLFVLCSGACRCCPRL